MSDGSVSWRHSLRFPPSRRIYDASTIVLTSPQRRFVDLRILLDEHKSLPKGDLPQSLLEWGIAGTSSSEMKPGPDGEMITHCVWKHWIDSRTREASGVVDQGDVFNQEDGTTLEKGRMVNPESGVEEDYEEVWQDWSIDRVPRTASGVVLEMRDDASDARGMVILVGEFCQGIMRVGDKIFVERWIYRKASQRWTPLVATQQLALPCHRAISMELWTMGDRIKHFERDWVVVEVGPVCNTTDET